MPVLGTAYTLAFYLTHCRDEAEDLLQDVSVRAFLAFHQFQAGTNFKAWFLRILVNSFRTRYRRSQRQPKMIPLDDAPDLYLYRQTAGMQVSAAHANPASLLIQKMSGEQIKQAMLALPEDYQVVCLLYFMEEASYQQIADILDCPIGTVRSRLHRGRKLLQKALWLIAEEQGVTALLNESRRPDEGNEDIGNNKNKINSEHKENDENKASRQKAGINR